MQNRYVGDVGDFGKYGLLRSLGAGLSLGVVWYLTPDEGHNADGKHVSYLEPTAANLARYRGCDPELYDALAGIMRDEARSVGSVRERGVLPEGTTFYDEVLTYDGMPGIGPRALAARLDRRRRWVDQALHATESCEFVFLDPDNGLEAGTRRHERLGPKYAYVDELQPYVRRGKSLVVYHHLDRSAPALEQVEALLARLGDRLEGSRPLHALLYRRGTLRAFLVVPAPAHEVVLASRIDLFINSPWSRHFNYLSAPGDTVAV